MTSEIYGSNKLSSLLKQALDTLVYSFLFTISLFRLVYFYFRDRSGLWQKKALKKSTLPRKKKKHSFSNKKKAPISQTKSTFGAEKALSKDYFI